MTMRKQRSVSIYYERSATKAERRRDKEARTMAEWVHITFRLGSPKIVVNRNLCA